MHVASNGDVPAVVLGRLDNGVDGAAQKHADNEGELERREGAHG